MCNLARVFFLLLTVGLVCAPIASSQNLTRREKGRSVEISQDCEQKKVSDVQKTKIQPDDASQQSNDLSWTYNRCNTCDLARTPDQNPGRSQSLGILDPVDIELKSMGQSGRVIQHARQVVLGIFETESSCSAWFKQTEADPATKFRSLQYVVDGQGPGFILKLQDTAKEWFYQQPYVASSFENAGANSVITINAKGAFFQQTAGVRVVPRDGGLGGLHISMLQHVDIYTGGTSEAQIVTLLHEFGHIVGLLPVDFGTPEGPQLSTENTQRVLGHCRTEVEAGAKHASKE